MSFFIIFCAVLAHGSGLNQVAEAFPTRGSFVSLEDFWKLFQPARLMIRTDLFNSPLGVDIVEALRLQLGLQSRNDAIKHFLKFNKPEVKAAMRDMHRSMNEAKMILFAVRSNLDDMRIFINPLRHSVSAYLECKRNRPCLCDSLPSGVRYTEYYDLVFEQLDATNYPVITGDVPGIVAELPSETFEGSNRSFCGYKNGVIKLPRSIIDLHAKSALRIREPFSLIEFDCDARLLVMLDASTNRVLFWRGDAIEPSTADVSRMADVAVVLGRSHYYIGYKGRQTDNTHRARVDFWFDPFSIPAGAYLPGAYPQIPGDPSFPRGVYRMAISEDASPSLEPLPTRSLDYPRDDGSWETIHVPIFDCREFRSMHWPELMVMKTGVGIACISRSTASRIHAMNVALRELVENHDLFTSNEALTDHQALFLLLVQMFSDGRVLDAWKVLHDSPWSCLTTTSYPIQAIGIFMSTVTVDE